MPIDIFFHDEKIIDSRHGKCPAALMVTGHLPEGFEI
jgi:hypothetical protein